MRDEARLRGGGARRAPRALSGAAVGCAMVGALAGCVRPAAVGRYARAAGKTAAELPALATDMHASCVRLESYRAARAGSGWFDPGDSEARCAERLAAGRRAVAVERVLARYFAALAALADNEVPSYDSELDALAKSLVDDAGLDRKQTAAVSDLAAFAGSVMTDGYRKAKLATVIEQQSSNVATVIDALTTIVGTDYTALLGLEKSGMESFYHSALAEGAEREPLAAILVLDARDARERELRDKRAALDSYVRALATMKAGHQRLYDSRHDLEAKELAGELAGYAVQLEEIIPALRKAF